MNIIIEGEKGDYVASLDVTDIDDIFGAGETALDAIVDLYEVLAGTKEHLGNLYDELSPRLKRQYDTLVDIT